MATPCGTPETRTPDGWATRLSEVAVELAWRVREYGPEDNGRWLRGRLHHDDDLWGLVFVLAAAVPVDQPWSELTGWARPVPARRGRKPAAVA